jgi:hypothetical protein
MKIYFNKDLNFESHLQIVLQTQQGLFSNSLNQKISVMNSTDFIFSWLQHEEPEVHRGSRAGWLCNLPKDFKPGYQQLYNNNFCDDPVDSEYLFRFECVIHFSWRLSKMSKDMTVISFKSLVFYAVVVQAVACNKTAKPSIILSKPLKYMNILLHN